MTSTAQSAKRVTAADVARSLGISRATVGFVLNDTPGQTISEATRARVLDEAKRLGYRANTAARALASGRSRIILLVLPDWPLDYAMRTHLDEASLALDEAGYALVTMTPHPGGQAQPLWETLRPDVVMGMTPFTVEQLESIRASGDRARHPPAAGGGAQRRRPAGICRRTPPAGGAPALPRAVAPRFRTVRRPSGVRSRHPAQGSSGCRAPGLPRLRRSSRTTP